MLACNPTFPDIALINGSNATKVVYFVLPINVHNLSDPPLIKNRVGNSNINVTMRANDRSGKARCHAVHALYSSASLDIDNRVSVPTLRISLNILSAMDSKSPALLHDILEDEPLRQFSSCISFALLRIHPCVVLSIF